MWEREIPVSEISPGPHEPSILVVASEGERCYRPDPMVRFEAE